MMKGFVSVFKMLGLATLAIGLMVAGCASPSDTADQVNNMVDRGAFTIPVTYDAASNDLVWGDGGNSGVALFDGHTVEVTDTGCAGVGTDVSPTNCTIRVINRDSDEYMVETTLLLSFCADCLGNENFKNADCQGEPCAPCGGVDATGDNGTCAGDAGINFTGYCVAENGNYTLSQPYTQKGCDSYNTVTSDYKPRQHIGPVCGNADLGWDFAAGADGHNFTFYANIAATWHPMNPTSDARVTAADWQNRSTMMIMIVDLDDLGTDAMFLWNIGSYQKSTVLAGGNTAPSHVNLPANKYFALNLAVELPNRMEQQHPGYNANFQPYEYTAGIASIVRFNPAVVRPIAVEGPTDATWFTYLLAGGADNCMTCSHDTGVAARKLYPSVNGFESHGNTNTVITFADKGFVYGFPLMKVDAFSWTTPAPTGAAWKYYSQGGAFVCTRTAGAIPVHTGHYGRTRVNPAVMNCTGTLPLHTNELTILTEDGVDAAPDIPVGLFYFRVQPVGGGTSPSGMGTMFYPEMHSGYFWYAIYHSDDTAAGGAVSLTDWLAPCIPMDPAWMDDAHQGCTDGKILAVPDVDYVWQNSEQSNPKIAQTGFSTPGNGAFQAWSASMCVQ